MNPAHGISLLALFAGVVAPASIRPRKAPPSAGAHASRHSA